MRISDWSSDVCSSDLVVGVCRINEPFVGKRSRYGAKHSDDILLDIPNPGTPERIKHKKLKIKRLPVDAKVIAPNLDKPNFIETTRVRNNPYMFANVVLEPDRKRTRLNSSH